MIRFRHTRVRSFRLKTDIAELLALLAASVSLKRKKRHTMTDIVTEAIVAMARREKVEK